MGTKSKQLLTNAAKELADELKAEGWKQKEWLSAGIVALHGSDPVNRLRCKKVAYSKEETGVGTRTVPFVAFEDEQKKRQVYEELLKSVMDSPDLPPLLKKKIRRDLKEAMKQLSQQTQNNGRGRRAKAD